MADAIKPVTMPKWGMTMTEGKLVGWLAREGDTVATGQDIMEIETEKITNVVEAHETGRVARVLVAEGETAPVGALLAVLVDGDAAEADLDAFIAGYAEKAGSAAQDDTGGPRADSVAVGPHTLAYTVSGDSDGTPIVLLHGFGGDRGAWLFNSDALADGRRVYALDLPAHGGSSATLEPGSIDEIATIVVDTLAALALKKVHLVGHSLGGGVAILVASRVAETIASLTLVAPVGLGETISDAYLEGFLAAERRRPMNEALSHLFADPDAMSAQMVENVLRFKRLEGVTDALTAIAAHIHAGQGRQSVSLTETLESLSTPTLVLWGESDGVIPPPKAEALPERVRRETIADAGHMPMMENPAATNAAIARHVTENEPA